MAYRVEYSPEAERHLRVLTPRQQRIILDAIDTQLSHQPTLETRNRKPMRSNPLAPWALRVGHLRVYYEVEEAAQRVVLVRAVGIKL
ncbi:MAG: addiction module toxin RelE, partial [Candidatus Omnitrophica bacterium]|nr:addiction module toxin RelE [Candidatus Omnitrophota bacterium]